MNKYAHRGLVFVYSVKKQTFILGTNYSSATWLILFKTCQLPLCKLITPWLVDVLLGDNTLFHLDLDSSLILYNEFDKRINSVLIFKAACDLTLSTKPPPSVYDTVSLSWSGLANMEATRTTGSGTSRGTDFTELMGTAHILIFLKDLLLAA